MREVVFIGNRSNVVLELLKMTDFLHIKNIFVLNNSPLSKIVVNLDVTYRLFDLSKSDKISIINYLTNESYDLLISNGCPFILPISALKTHHPNSLFINIHPTYLPHLRGKTPLNGVIMLKYDFIGATVHFIDDGVDTGNIIYQKKVKLTKEIDQGLIYYLSFDLEGIVFKKAMKILINSGFKYEGKIQCKTGTYFDREKFDFEVDFIRDNSEFICRKINALGITSMGNKIALEDNLVVKAIHCESITNKYIINKFASQKPSKILYAYDDILLIKTIDGIIKVRVSYLSKSGSNNK